MKLCECGCGSRIPDIGSRGTPIRFVNGHNTNTGKVSMRTRDYTRITDPPKKGVHIDYVHLQRREMFAQIKQAEVQGRLQ